MPEVHNGIKYGTGIAGAASVAIGIDTNATGVERLGETLTPILDLWDRSEWSYLRGEFLWARGITAGAVVGELSMVAIAPPVLPTGWLLTIDNASTGGNNLSVQAGFATRAAVAATLASVGFGNPRDTRWTSGLAVNFDHPGVEVFSGSDPGSLITRVLEKQINGVAAETPFQSVPWIVKPNLALVLSGTVANTAFDVNVSGRVRQALPGELPGS